jgi:hypothetical protein
MALNYKEDVRINEQELDLEWLDQPERAMQYGREWARLRKKVALLDESVKVIRSELIRKAWENPTKYLGQPKGSVQTVEAFYRNHKKHKVAKQLWIEAQEELDLAEVAKNEMSFTRKSALENMVKLFAADYFAGPNVPRDLKTERKKRDESRKEAMDSIKKVKRNKKQK